jgi:alpha-tubulin suppressor-like RCC1 family protein
MYAAAHIQECTTPQQVFANKHHEKPICAVAVSAGERHMLITTPDGRILGAGQDDWGQLGDGGEPGDDYKNNEDWNEIHLVEVLMPEG